MYKNTLFLVTLAACMLAFQCTEGGSSTPPTLEDDDSDDDDNDDDEQNDDDDDNDDDNDENGDDDDSGGDSDADGDTDADGDSDADGDTDTDADTDSDTDDIGCPINSGFPCACNADPCDDGGSCLTFASGGADVGFCAIECTDESSCTGTMGYGDSGQCLVDTTSDSTGDHCTLLCTEGGNACPEGLTCQAVSGVDWFACY